MSIEAYSSANPLNVTGLPTLVNTGAADSDNIDNSVVGAFGHLLTIDLTGTGTSKVNVYLKTAETETGHSDSTLSHQRPVGHVEMNGISGKNVLRVEGLGKHNKYRFINDSGADVTSATVTYTDITTA